MVICIYVGKENSSRDGVDFITKKFRQELPKNRNFISHITCCTDTGGMQNLLSSVTATLIGKAILSAGYS